MDTLFIVLRWKQVLSIRNIREPSGSLFCYSRIGLLCPRHIDEVIMKALQAHLMHESGKDFQEIARALDITPAEAAKLWVSVEKAHERFKQKVVYRKRLTNVGIKSRHKKLVKHMRTL